MKKFSFGIITFIIIAFLAASSSFTAGTITERPEVKVINDGGICTFNEVLIIMDGRVLLPLRAILVSLGVKNDDSHILWKAEDSSVTINKDSTTIYLKVDNKTAYVNNVPMVLDAAPVIYKNRTYIPARFVSQSLGKKVAWDGDSSTVLIRNQSDFDNIYGTLVKVDSAMKNTNKAQYNIQMDTTIYEGKTKSKMTIDARGSIDRQKKIIHFTKDMDVFGDLMKPENYYSNNIQYTKDSTSGQWVKDTLQSKEFDGLFDDNDYTKVLGTADALCAGLIMDNSTNPDKIILKGNVNLKGFLDRVAKSAAIDSYKLGSVYTEITIDMKTSLIDKINMNISGSLVFLMSNQQFSSQITCTYSNINGNFVLTLPKG